MQFLFLTPGKTIEKRKNEVPKVPFTFNLQLIKLLESLLLSEICL